MGGEAGPEKTGSLCSQHSNSAPCTASPAPTAIAAASCREESISVLNRNAKVLPEALTPDSLATYQ
jgi:hypothetical protein